MKNTKDTQERELVFILGPGKSGTKTAAMFCNQQLHMVGVHEGRFGLANLDHCLFPDIIRYQGDYEGVKCHIKKLNFLADMKEMATCRKVTHIAEAGMYFLEYVEILLDYYQNPKFVCFERDHEKTIKSWLDITGDTIRHWSTGGTKGYQPFFTKVVGRHWDQCFPKYDLPHEEACRAYVKNYYQKVERLQLEYPQSVRKLSFESFVENKDLRTVFFDFINYKGKRKYHVPHEHRDRLLKKIAGKI